MTAKFRKKPITIEAYQWFEMSPYVEGVKRDVDYYRHPPIDPVTGEVSAADNALSIGILAHSDSQLPERMRRDTCNAAMDDHGYIDTLEGGHTVCPGDWIITGVQGEKYPCKPDIFASTYDATDSDGEVTGTTLSGRPTSAMEIREAMLRAEKEHDYETCALMAIAMSDRSSHKPEDSLAYTAQAQVFATLHHAQIAVWIAENRQGHAAH